MQKLNFVQYTKIYYLYSEKTFFLQLLYQFFPIYVEF